MVTKQWKQFNVWTQMVRLLSRIWPHEGAKDQAAVCEAQAAFGLGAMCNIHEGYLITLIYTYISNKMILLSNFQ